MTGPSPAALGDRSLFPDLEAEAFLAHAAVSAPPLPARQAAVAMLDDYTAHGSGAVMRAFEQRERLKNKLGQLIGARPDCIALTPSTTWGVTSVAQSLPWKEGDTLVLFEGEFPANVTPWQRVAQARGLQIRWVKAESFSRDVNVGLAELSRALEGGVRLCAVSFVQFRDGLRMPLAQIAESVHRAGGELFVDAIQGTGVVPIDVSALSIDYLACGAHKWLLSLEGAGFLYVKRALFDALEPMLAGWLSHTEPLDFLIEDGRKLRYDKGFAKGPGMFEVGSSASVAFAALEASVDVLLSLGIDSIYAHVQGYHDALEAPLEDLGLRSLRAPGLAQRSGSLSFDMPKGESVQAIARSLREAGIVCSTPDGALRFAPHFANSLDEVPKVIAAVERALDGRGRSSMRPR